ncbi:hypothetical protein L1887_45917 [Cichorium endivia]|nr:hypothetical protein L1887_45917 [Cichorium endivia]
MSFRPDRPAEAGPWVQKEGHCPASDSRNNRIPLVRTSSELAVRRPGKAPEGAVPSPSPGRHAATRSRRGSSSSSSADSRRYGSGLGPRVPSPQSQSFSRGYGSILPTSLAYIVPSTRGCSPWRPDAVMSTTGRGRHSVLRIFKGRRGRTGHRATCGALPAAGPYLRLSREVVTHSLADFDFHDHRPAVLIDQHPLWVLVSLRASTRVSSGFAPLRHSSPSFRVPTGMLTLEPFSEDQGRSAVHPARGIPPISFLAPCGFTHPLTRTHVRLLGPCFQDGPNGVPTGRCRGARRYIAETARAANTRSTRRHLHEPIDSSGFGPPHQSAPVHAPSRSADRLSPFQHPTGTHRRPPIRFPPDNFKHSLTLFSKSFSSFPRGYLFAIGLTPTAPRGATGVRGHDGGSHPLWRPLPGDLGPVRRWRTLPPDYNSDSEAVRFSSWADPGSLAVTKGILVHVHGSFCFAGFDNDPSAGSPTETLLRLLLPLNDKACFEHSNFFKVTAPEARPGQLRPGAHRRQKGRVNRCTPEGGPADPTQSPIYELFNCNNIKYTLLELELPRLLAPDLPSQWILVKGFRLYSFQLPDSFEARYCYLLSLPPRVRIGVICAPAAFLGCGSRFSGSLSGIEP